jgi:hypothetical protein
MTGRHRLPRKPLRWRPLEAVATERLAIMSSLVIVKCYVSQPLEQQILSNIADLIFKFGNDIVVLIE